MHVEWRVHVSESLNREVVRAHSVAHLLFYSKFMKFVEWTRT
jgi:hypothetical protein